jgi:8-oxo-dGTP pyrophosphatase MutT (NUDIX family)
MSPGKWDISCGGHILSGDEPELSLKRELEEELGIKNATLKFVEKYIDGDDNQTELIYLYYVIVDKKESEFVLQEEEVEKVEWIDVSKAMMSVIDGSRKSTHWIFDQVPRIFQKIFRESSS